jgi:hypothetical protein
MHELDSLTQVERPLGEGAMMMALRPLSALMILFAGVAPGWSRR